MTLNVSGGDPGGIFFIPYICTCWSILFCAFSKWFQVRMKSLSSWNCWDSHGTWPKDINKNENKHSKHTLLFGKSKGSFSGESQPLSLHKTCLGKPVRRLVCYLVTRNGNPLCPLLRNTYGIKSCTGLSDFNSSFVPQLTVSLVLCAHTLTHRQEREGG